jgi:hypothetical protein
MIHSSTRWLSGRLSRVLGAGLVMLLALLSVASPAAAKTSGQQLPFKGTLQAVETVVGANPGPPLVLSIVANGSGQGTQLGRFI